MPKVYKKDRKEQGQSMVEFAISAVIMLLLLAAVADFGRAFFTYVAMRDAAQEGAVYGSICPRVLSAIQNRALTSSERPINLYDLYNNGDIEINCTYLQNGAACGSGTPSIGYGIQVEVVYPEFPLTVPILTNIIGTDHLRLRAVVEDTILRNGVDDCISY